MIQIKLINDSYCVMHDDKIIKSFSTMLDNARGLAIDYVNKLKKV